MITSLKDLCEKYQISVRQLAEVCGDTTAGVGKSSAHKLINGKAAPEYIDRVLPHVVISLFAYLAVQGVPSETIAEDIRAAFPQIDPTRSRETSATLVVRHHGRVTRVVDYIY